MISTKKNHDKSTARLWQRLRILPIILTFFLISAANRQVFAQQCSAVTFAQSFSDTIFSGGSAAVASSVEAIDFNRDGNQDFALTQLETDTVFIFLGNGRGKFTKRSFATINAPRSLTIADFNRDAKPDVIVFSSTNAAVHLGDGSGNFNVGQTLLGVGNGALIDFNDDGRLDLLNISISTNLKVFNGNTDGTFANPVNITLQVGIVNPIAGDFNRDGKIDLIAPTSPGVRNLVFLPGDGAGGFGAPTTFTSDSIGVGILFKIINAGDLNADGKSDLIVTGDSQTNAARILLGASAGVFTLSEFITAPNGNRFDDVQTADFNRDGKLDLALFINRSVEIRLGNNTGTFVSSRFADSGGDFNALADFNNDGKIDIASDNVFTARVNLNQCGGLTDKPDSDFDGDGRADIAVFRPSAGAWFILRSSNNSFQVVQWGASGDVPVAGDYDGDGRADVAVFRPASNNWFILKSSDGTFSAVQFGSNGDQPTPADYDGDGKTDICVFRPAGGNWFRLNSSNGQFIAVQFGTNGDIPIR